MLEPKLFPNNYLQRNKFQSNCPNKKGKSKVWLELARTIVTSAGQASYIANDGSLEEKREFVKKIGSNFRLAGATLLFSYNLPYNFLAQKLKYEKWGRRLDQVRTSLMASTIPLHA